MFRSKTTIDITNFLTTKVFLSSVAQSNIILVGRPLKTLNKKQSLFTSKGYQICIKKSKKKKRNKSKHFRVFSSKPWKMWSGLNRKTILEVEIY